MIPPHDDSDFRRWERDLNPSERLLWVGRPNVRFALDKTALWQCIPAFALIGYFLFQLMTTGSVVYTPDDVINQQFLWFALAAVIWCLGYVLYHSLNHPALTRYAVTNSRALIRSTVPFGKSYSRYLTPVTDIEWDGQTPGNIWFDTREQNYGMNTWIRGIVAPAVVKTRKTGFINIDKADQVHSLIGRVMEGKA